MNQTWEGERVQWQTQITELLADGDMKESIYCGPEVRS